MRCFTNKAGLERAGHRPAPYVVGNGISFFVAPQATFLSFDCAILSLEVKDMKDKKSKGYMKDICPVCGKSRVGHFEICPVCGWSNDFVQAEDPDFKHGDNSMSLNEAKKAWKEGREIY